MRRYAMDCLMSMASAPAFAVSHFAGDNDNENQALGLECEGETARHFLFPLKYRRSGGGWSVLVGIRKPSALSM
jgi:hypothetical protein